MSQKKTLDRIKSGAMARTMAFARFTVSAGARAASHAVNSVFTGEEGRTERAKQLLQSQVVALVEELGQLKGSAMKAGQMLSMYGEHFLPPEANALLKSLQSQSPPLEWEPIRQVLEHEFSPEQLATIEIDHAPLAAASLGQVHQARRRSDGKILAVKVQYPGVRDAIAADLRAIRGMLSLSRLMPRSFDHEGFFDEIKTMLEQEANYQEELRYTLMFRRFLADDKRFIVAEPIQELCTERVITTSFEEGIAPDSLEVAGLPQERRNALGSAYLDLYMRELWEFGQVQTDPHFGNYRVRLGENGAPDQLVILDFGAVRAVPEQLRSGYRDMVVGTLHHNPQQICAGGNTLGFLRDDEPEAVRNLFAELCTLICEPFMPGDSSAEAAHLFDDTGAYDWGRSDLPRRATRRGAEAAMQFKLRAPPRESIFLDRKLGGVFIFLSVLGVKLRGRDLLARYLPL